MHNTMSTVAKTVGISLAVGGAAAVMSTALTNTSTKRKIMKSAKKAGTVLNGMLNNAQYMMK